jgi:ribosomal-protein-serine acetyltransferase
MAEKRRLEAVDKKQLPREIKFDDIVLRILSKDLAKPLYEMSVEYLDYIGQWLNKPWKLQTLEDLGKYIEKAEQKYQNFEKAKYAVLVNGQFAGLVEMISLSYKHGEAEFGYFLSPEFAGKGLISRSIKVLENILFSMGFERLVIRAAVQNVLSQNVAKRNGYKLEGKLRHSYFNIRIQDYVDTYIFSKIKREWEAGGREQKAENKS